MFFCNSSTGMLYKKASFYIHLEGGNFEAVFLKGKTSDNPFIINIFGLVHEYIHDKILINNTDPMCLFNICISR